MKNNVFKGFLYVAPLLLFVACSDSETADGTYTFEPTAADILAAEADEADLTLQGRPTMIEDAEAGDGQALMLVRTGDQISMDLRALETGTYQVEVRARAELIDSTPELELRLNRELVDTQVIENETYETVSFGTLELAGEKRATLRFEGASRRMAADSKIIVDSVELSPAEPGDADDTPSEPGETPEESPEEPDSPDEPAPEDDPVPSEDAPTDLLGQPTLLSRYNVRVSNVVAGELPDYRLSYLPRQFAAGLELAETSVEDAGAYAGWDVLSTPVNTAARSGRGTTPGGVAEGAPWLDITLNRDAQLAVMWPAASSAPSWLSDWSAGTAVSMGGASYQVYEKSYPAGEVVLNAPASDTNYFLLIAEADGNPSAAPEVPAGLDTPQPGATCPSWVHDQYRAEGPDGNYYPSWHPQIDPVYACSFGHEHGSDPSLVPGEHETIFGYVASRVPQIESHEGFKNIVTQAEDGTWWTLTVHAKTSDTRRYCEQLHTLKLKAVSPQGELLADLQYKGDFGASKNTDDSLIQLADCSVSQAEIAERSPYTSITFPVAGSDSLEQWQTQIPQGNFGKADSGRALGLQALSLIVYMVNPALLCEDTSCSEFVTEASGERRVMIPVSGFELSAAAAGTDGTFYTDPYANELRSGSEDDAVAQYIKPGLELSMSGGSTFNCVTTDAFRMLYTCGEVSTFEFVDATPNMNIGGALKDN